MYPVITSTIGGESAIAQVQLKQSLNMLALCEDKRSLTVKGMSSSHGLARGRSREKEWSVPPGAWRAKREFCPGNPTFVFRIKDDRWAPIQRSWAQSS